MIRHRSLPKLSPPLLLGSLMVLNAGIAVHAQTTVIWTGTTNEFWDNDANWDSGTAPTAADDVRFDATSGQFTVDLGTGNRTVAGLTLDSATAYTISNPQGVWLAPGDVTVASGTGHTFATTINLANGTTPTYDIASGADLTISGVIDEYEDGTAGLTKSGDGTLILTANNLYTGGTTIAGGTLQLGNGGTTGTVKGDIVNDGTLVFNRSNNLTYSGVISGTGNLTKEGTGTLTLSGASTFSGATNVNAGTLALSYNHPDALSDSAVTVGAGGTVYLDDQDSGTQFAFGSLSGSGALGITGSGLLEVGGNNATTTFSGTITGTAASSSFDYFIKSGTGTLTLSAADLYLGNLRVDAGELKLDGTTGEVFGGTQVNADATLTVQNVGTDLDLGLLINYGETLVTGASTTLKASTGISNRGQLTLTEGASAQSNAFFYSNAESTTVVDQASLTFGYFDSGATGTISLTDSINGGSALTVGKNNNNSTFAGVIEDYTSGPGSVTKVGTNTVILTGANTYTGGTTLSAGTLQLGDGGTTGSIVGDVANSGALVFKRSDTATYTGLISGTGSVEQAGAGTTILTADHTYTGTTTISAGTLEFTGGTSATTLTGNIANTGTLAINRSADLTLSGTLSGTGALTKDGAGTLTLTANNTYSGGTTTINGGTLRLGSGGTTGSLVGDIVNDGAIVLDRSNFFSFGNAISGTGSLEQAGSGFTILAGENTFSGATTVTGGTLLLGNALALQNSTLTLDGAGVFDFNGTDATLGGLAGANDLSLGSLAIAIGNNGDDTTYAGVLSGTGSLTKTGAGTFTLSGANTYSGGTTIDAGTLQLGDGGATGSILGDVVDNGTLAFNRSDASLVIAAAISGTGGVTQNGPGVLNLTGTNTFTGDVTINSGQILLGSATEFSSNTVVNNTTDGLDLNGFDATLGGLAGSGDLALGAQSLTVGGNNTPTTYAGALSGTGGLTKTGTGTLVLSGANTYAGGTAISEGTLQLGNSGSAGSIVGDVTIGDNGTLAFNRSDDVTFANTLSGTGSVSQAGAGTTVFTTAQTYTGGTTISAGTLQLGDGGTTGSILGDITTAAGGTLAFNHSDDVTFGNVISGAGRLTQAGPGTLILTANQTFTGGTTIETGSTLQLGTGDDGGTAGTVKGNIANDGTLVFNRSNNLTYSGVISGTGDLTKEGSGTLTLSGKSTFSGATTVRAGTLALAKNHPEALTQSAVTIEATGTVTLDGDDGDADFVFGSLAGSGTLNLETAKLYVGGDDTSTLFSGSVLDSSNSSKGDLRKAGVGTLTLSGVDFDIGKLYVEKGEAVLDDVTGSIEYLSSGDKLTVQNVGTGLTVDRLGSEGEVFIAASNLTAGRITNFDNITLLEGTTLNVTGTFLQTGSATTVVDQSRLLLTDFLGASGTIRLSDPTDGGSALTIGQSASGSATLASVIKDYTSGSGSVTKTGTNTIILSSANTYTGTTTISAGKFRLGNARALQNSTVSIDVNDGLDLNGYAATLGGLAGSGNLALGSQALTIGGNGADTTYTGILSGTDGSLAKTGDGTLILTGTNTYTGGTTIDGGTLQLGAGGTTGAVAGNILNNGTLTIDRTDDFTFSGLISGTGDLAKLGTGGDLTLSAANTFSGTTTIEEGRIFLGNSLALQNSTVALSRDYSLGLNGNSATLGALSGTGAIYVSGTRTLTVGGNGADTTYSGSVQGDGGGNFQKEGAGTLVLTGTNTYTGTTTINAGTLQIGDGGTTGKLPGNVTNNATLAFNRSDATTYAGIISGTGALTQEGTGTLTLTGVNTYTGTTTVNAGQLIVNGSAATSAFTVNSGATLGGSGTIGALTISSGGILAPGNSPGTLSLTDVTLTSAALVQIELAGYTQGTDYDYLNISGTATLDGTLELSFLHDFAPQVGDTFSIASWTSHSGEFSSIGGTYPTGYTFSATYSDTGLTLTTLSTSAVPEPGTYALFAGLLAAGAAITRRRRRAQL